VLLRRTENLFCAVSVILLPLNALINKDAVGSAQVPGTDAACLVCRALPYAVWRRVWGSLTWFIWSAIQPEQPRFIYGGCYDTPSRTDRTH